MTVFELLTEQEKMKLINAESVGDLNVFDIVNWFRTYDKELNVQTRNTYGETSLIAFVEKSYKDSKISLGFTKESNGDCRMSVSKVDYSHNGDILVDVGETKTFSFNADKDIAHLDISRNVGDCHEASHYVYEYAENGQLNKVTNTYLEDRLDPANYNTVEELVFIRNI